MYLESHGLPISFPQFLFIFTTLTSSVYVLQGVLAANNTDEVNAEQQDWLNNTAALTPENEVIEGDATGDEVRENEATEAAEATEVGENETEATEPQATVSTETTEAAPPSHNMTRTQAIKEWSSRLLATKYMGSLALLYLALCILLAIKKPLFVT